MAFDYEGVPKQRVSLVEAGVCRDVVYDSQTAARGGHALTGHGLPAPNPWGPFPLNAVMSAGSVSREELIGGLDRGLLVTRFHYTNVVHPKLAIITGMTTYRDPPEVYSNLWTLRFEDDRCREFTEWWMLHTSD